MPSYLYILQVINLEAATLTYVALFYALIGVYLKPLFRQVFRQKSTEHKSVLDKG